MNRKTFWENKGVVFKQVETIGMALSGATTEPYLTWTAVFKGKFIANGGSSLDRLIEWMDGKEEKMVQRIELVNNNKLKSKSVYNY